MRAVATAGPNGRTFDLCADIKMSVGIEKPGPEPGFHCWVALSRTVAAGRGRGAFRWRADVWNLAVRTRSWRWGSGGGMVVSIWEDCGVG